MIHDAATKGELDSWRATPEGSLAEIIVLDQLSIDGKVINDYESFAELDFSGDGVVATNEKLLKLMKALVLDKLVRKDTLIIMENDST